MVGYKEDLTMGTLVTKIDKIKSSTKTWERNKKKQLIKDLKEITRSIFYFGKYMEDKIPPQQYLDRLKLLEERKNEILKIQDISWRLKIRENWLEIETQSFFTSILLSAKTPTLYGKLIHRRGT